MPVFRLRVAFRERHGIVRAPVGDARIEASCLRDAIGAVLGGSLVLSQGTNFAWLTDDCDNLLWTLRMDDQNADST